MTAARSSDAPTYERLLWLVLIVGLACMVLTWFVAVQIGRQLERRDIALELRIEGAR